jgi:hypothetical protein
MVVCLSEWERKWGETCSHVTTVCCDSLLQTFVAVTYISSLWSMDFDALTLLFLTEHVYGAFSDDA